MNSIIYENNLTFGSLTNTVFSIMTVCPPTTLWSGFFLGGGEWREGRARMSDRRLPNNNSPRKASERQTRLLHPVYKLLFPFYRYKFCLLYSIQDHFILSEFNTKYVSFLSYTVNLRFKWRLCTCVCVTIYFRDTLSLNLSKILKFCLLLFHNIILLFQALLEAFCVSLRRTIWSDTLA